MTEVQSANRIYYDEPGTLEFTAEVTAIRELARVDGQQVWQIALDRTAFYPTSGGQPYDMGVLIATARSGASLEVPITNVEEDEAGEVWHTTSKPLQEGTVVSGRIETARRRDHMQQHSGQHLLSAILDRDFAARTVSFHLGDEISTIDLEGPALTDAQLQSAAAEANRIIAAALPLSIRYVTSEEAAAMKEQGLLRKLPPRSGKIRIIEIPGIDTNACGGTHVATTAEIGPLLLRGTEKVRGNLRLSFVCGNRALAAVNADFRRLQEAASMLTTAPSEIAASIERIRTENRALQKERANLLEQIASLEATKLASTADGSVIHSLPPDRDAAYAKLLASKLVRETATQVAYIVAIDNERANAVLAAKPGVLDCGTTLRTALNTLGARGGGSAEMAQGAVPVEQAESLLNTLRASLP
ncbi:alanyl-tRNA editing protein [Terriglobus roseus]|uniref:Alanine--tRNA ligase n=1 Tax=Terriglobus roseus TaxID=392734 RepID=A0A1G7GES5_9BACT|nr:alanyl-tRNA editing protein [Terriglobus roseus]SDE86595.1 alanyl-tRNA synthetase [Terriglobus roseus]